MHLEEYVGMGYHGIVEIHSKHRESSSQRDDYYDETFACLDEDGNPFRIRVEWYFTIFKPAKHDVSSRTPISREEYEELVKTRGIRDTDAWRAQRDAARKSQEEAAKIRERITPHCPKCNATMVIRSRKKDGKEFFGCSQYPKCDGVRPGNAALIRRLKGLPR